MPSLTAIQIVSLQVHFDIKSQDAKTALQSAAPVAVERVGLFEMKLSIASHEKYLTVPCPLMVTAAKTRIARKQLWIEYTAPVADMQSLTVQPAAVFPVSVLQGCDNPTSMDSQRARADILIRGLPALEHLAYVDADRLPTPRLGSSRWLTMHTPYAATMSGSEYKDYKKVRADDGLVMPGRLGVKETLHNMHMHV